MKKLNMQETTSVLAMKGAEADIPCERFSDEGWVRTPVHVPREMELTIYVNSKELVTILCTPTKLDCLVLGFLYSQGIISGVGDLASMRVCEEESLADVRLSNPEYKLPTQRTLTSGCGGGVAFITKGQRVDSDLVVTPAEVLSLMKQFQKQTELYRLCGGVHASALADTKNLLVVAEDIGRHNTLDKIQGECLLRGLSVRDGLLLSTGRVSSEMLLKAAKMQAPVVVSRTSPTGRAISLAHDLGITLVGYARGSRLSVYAHPERLGRSSDSIRMVESGRRTR
jgi:FdhD protein